jgi:hypothetical protein
MFVFLSCFVWLRSVFDNVVVDNPFVPVLRLEEGNCNKLRFKKEMSCQEERTCFLSCTDYKFPPSPQLVVRFVVGIPFFVCVVL